MIEQLCSRLIQSIRLHWWCSASCFIRFPQLQSTPVFLYCTDVTRAIAHRALSSSKTQVTQLSTVPKLLLCWHTHRIPETSLLMWCTLYAVILYFLNFVHLCRSHITLRFQTERVCHVSVWKTVSVAIAQRMHDKYYYSTSCPRTHIRLSHCVLSLRQTRGRLLRPFLFFLCKLMASPVIRRWGCYRIFALLL